MNQWRSPTAEKIFQNFNSINTRSGGISPKAKRKISLNDLHWADLIFVMENKHKQRLKEEFSQELPNKPIHVLDIPDEYQFMDPELIEILKQLVEPILQENLLT